MSNLSEKEQRELLRVTFECQAEWRRQMAEQYPDDKRHIEAAEIFDKLAATVGIIPADVLSAYHALFENTVHGEAESEVLRSIGFGGPTPKNAEEFIWTFIAATVTRNR